MFELIFPQFYYILKSIESLKGENNWKETLSTLYFYLYYLENVKNWMRKSVTIPFTINSAIGQLTTQGGQCQISCIASMYLNKNFNKYILK